MEPAALSQGKSAAKESPLDPREEPLQFFNYHEYLVGAETPLGHHLGPKLVINHFPAFRGVPKTAAQQVLDQPSVEISADSSLRLVRIPRAFHTIENSDIVPQFSEAVPGTEDAALRDGESGFVQKGTFEGFPFTVTSATPLVPNLLLERDFHEIVTTVNRLLRVALDPFAWQNWTESLLDMLTLTIYSRIHKNRYERRGLQDLEDYVSKTNEYLRTLHPQLALISPRWNGYLSVS